MWNRIKQWWKAEGALVGLQGASDRMLADMGLERGELRERVMGQVSDDRTEPGVAVLIAKAAPAVPCRC